MTAPSLRRIFFRSLAEPWADTTTPAGRMVLTVFAGIAEFERSLIIDRTRNGREAAKARGVKFGPRPTLTPAQIEHARELIEAGAKRLSDAGVSFGHGTDNAFDESVWLTLWRLGLPIDDLDGVASNTVTSQEAESVTALFTLRIETRKPAAYLTNEAWLQGVGEAANVAQAKIDAVKNRMLPVIKGVLTDKGFDNTVAAQQVFGRREVAVDQRVVAGDELGHGLAGIGAVQGHGQRRGDTRRRRVGHRLRRPHRW